MIFFQEFFFGFLIFGFPTKELPTCQKTMHLTLSLGDSVIWALTLKPALTLTPDITLNWNFEITLNWNFEITPNLKITPNP